MGKIADGLEFLSFRINDTQVLPTRRAQRDLLERISAAIRDARRESHLWGADGRRAEPRFVQSLIAIDRKIRGWGDAFKPTTSRLSFEQLDDQIDRLLRPYFRWFRNHAEAVESRQRRRMMGIALLSDTPRP
jgi:hypothetical protein